MKKKIIALIVVCALINTVFVSCGKKDVKERENVTFNNTETETYKMVEKETTIEQKTTTETTTKEETTTTEVITTEKQTVTEATITAEMPTTEPPTTTEIPATTEAPTTIETQTTEDPLAWDAEARAERDNPNYWKSFIYKIVYNEDGTANLEETIIGQLDKTGHITTEAQEEQSDEIFDWLFCIDNKEYQDLLYSNCNYGVSYGRIRKYMSADYSHWDIRDYYICIRDCSQNDKLVKRWYVNDNFEFVEGLIPEDAEAEAAGIVVFR